MTVNAEAPATNSKLCGDRDLMADKTTRIIGLDLVRAAAIAAVLLAHMWNLTATWWPATWVLRVGGFVGVEAFFALSGFLVGGILYRSLVGGTLSLGRFWRRRCLRTIPAYVVFLTLNLLFARRFYGVTMSWPELGTYLLYVQNLGWQHPPLFPEAWSLAVEEWFYLVAPLLLLGFTRLLSNRWAYMAMAGLLVVVPLIYRLAFVAITEPSWDDGVRKIVLLRLDAIGVGVLVAGLHAQGCFEDRRVRSLSAALGTMLFMLSVVAYWRAASEGGLDMSYAMRTWLLSLCPLGAALTLPLFARIEHLPGHVVSLLVRWLAVISYSAYLCNLLILQVLMVSGRLRSLHPIWQVLLFLVGTLTVATAGYLAVERPFMQLARRLDAEQSQRSAQPRL